MADNKWIMVFITLAIVGFLIITSPGWNQVLGIAGQESMALTIMILVGVVAGLYWVVTSSGGK